MLEVALATTPAEVSKPKDAGPLKASDIGAGVAFHGSFGSDTAAHLQKKIRTTGPLPECGVGPARPPPEVGGVAEYQIDTEGEDNVKAGATRRVHKSDSPPHFVRNLQASQP